MPRHILNEENEPATRTQGRCSTDDTGVGQAVIWMSVGLCEHCAKVSSSRSVGDRRTAVTQAHVTVGQLGQSRKASVKPGSNPKASYGSKQDDIVKELTLQNA